jgi:hypothetical protein
MQGVDTGAYLLVLAATPAGCVAAAVPAAAWVAAGANSAAAHQDAAKQ